MPNILFIKVDLSRIDKARLFQGKNGAQYLDLVAFPTRDSKYGDSHFVTQSASKEERDGGLKMPIIGNIKPSTPLPPKEADKCVRNITPDRPKPAAQDSASDDCPF